MVGRSLLFVTVPVYSLLILTMPLAPAIWAIPFSSSSMPPQPLQAATFYCAISGSVGANVATFTGSITGGTPPITWNVDFGDGTSASGGGSTVSASHAYGQRSTYTATLVAFSTTPGGGTSTASCSTQVTVGGGYSVNVQESLNAVDSVVPVPPLNINENVGFVDRYGSKTPLAVNEGALVSDQPSLTGPGRSNETARVSDVVSVSKGSNNIIGSLLSPVGLVTLGVVGLGAGLVIWKLVVPRLSGRAGAPLPTLISERANDSTV